VPRKQHVPEGVGLQDFVDQEAKDLEALGSAQLKIILRPQHVENRSWNRLLRAQPRVLSLLFLVRRCAGRGLAALRNNGVVGARNRRGSLILASRFAVNHHDRVRRLCFCRLLGRLLVATFPFPLLRRYNDLPVQLEHIRQIVPFHILEPHAHTVSHEKVQ
jgi:hypothetical protein